MYFFRKVAKMMNGVVKWFNNKKGYGFITSSESAKDVFVHIVAVRKSGIHKILEGQEVSFEINADKLGRPEAHNICVLCADKE